VCAFSARGKAHIERMLLHVLEEEKARACTVGDAGKREQGKARQGDQYSESKVNLPGRKSTQPSRPSRPPLFAQGHDDRDSRC
jgi:hypothetical protein